MTMHERTMERRQAVRVASVGGRGPQVVLDAVSTGAVLRLMERTMRLMIKGIMTMHERTMERRQAVRVASVGGRGPQVVLDAASTGAVLRLMERTMRLMIKGVMTMHERTMERRQAVRVASVGGRGPQVVL